MNNKQTILAITGSDGTGGSGIQADIRCICELGGTVTSVVTSITVQNTLGIQEIDVVATIAEMMQKYHPRYIIYAPVQTSTHGDQLVEPQVFSAIKEQIIPLCTIVLEPSDLPSAIRLHGQANQLSAALAYYLSCGENTNEAMLHARTYLSQFPKGYTEDSSRSGELYNLFLDAVDRFHHHHLYSDVAFYAEQLGVSARYLGQVTRHVANRSPKSIIDERIMEEISTMLGTNKPLKEIAGLLGFSSQAHLSRYYKKQTGKAPSEVRKR